MRLFDTTGTILGATPVAIHSRSAWTDGKTITDDGVRKYAASLPAGVKYLILDLEVPALMELRGHLPGVKLDQVKRGVAVGIHVLDVIRAERPDLLVSWYDSDIEEYYTIYNAMEARIRRTNPRGDNLDEFFTGPNVDVNHAFRALGWLEWANDQLRDLHRAEGFSMRRAYFPFGAREAWQREGLIEYQWQQAVKQVTIGRK